MTAISQSRCARCHKPCSFQNRTTVTIDYRCQVFCEGCERDFKDLMGPVLADFLASPPRNAPK